jgi:carbon storage regulator
MLVLTRKKDQSIVINDNIEITILDVQGEQVRIGVNAPRNISVYRKEIFLQIAEENKKASEVNSDIDLSSIIKNKNKV